MDENTQVGNASLGEAPESVGMSSDGRRWK